MDIIPKSWKREKYFEHIVYLFHFVDFSCLVAYDEQSNGRSCSLLVALGRFPTTVCGFSSFPDSHLPSVEHVLFPPHSLPPSHRWR